MQGLELNEDEDGALSLTTLISGTGRMLLLCAKTNGTLNITSQPWNTHHQLFTNIFMFTLDSETHYTNLRSVMNFLELM